jgi:hypothetical protein
MSSELIIIIAALFISIGIYDMIEFILNLIRKSFNDKDKIV